MSHLSPIHADERAGFDDQAPAELYEFDWYPLPDDPAPNERVNKLIGRAICAFVGLSTLMFIAQFIRAWMAGLL